MDPWLIWLIIAIIGLVVAIVFFVLAMESWDYEGLFGVIALLAFIVFIGAITTAVVLGIQQGEQQAKETATEQGLVIVGSASKQSYYLVTNGTCTISADLINDKLVVVGSDPVIELTPALVDTICAGGPPR